MKILNLIQCANLGGTERASLRLMEGLKERGDSVQLLSLNPIGRFGPLLEAAGIPHEGLPYLGKGGWRSYGRLRQKLTTIEAEAVIMTGHHLLGSLALGDFCKGHRILAIHFHHGGVKSSWQWRLIYRVACARFDAITFPCDFIRKEAEAIHPPVARIAHTIRNPLQVPPLPGPLEKAEARNGLGLPLDRPIIGNAGWLIPRKRFDVFLRTARKILDKIPDALFIIAGGGDEEGNLKRLADELGISGNVRWLGWQQEMDRFYKALDVLLFNSDWDTLPTTPLEAMSFGVPVVCSVVNGGLNEIIHSDRVGLLRPSHDADTLSDLAVNLLKDHARAAAMGLAARAHLQTVCDPGPIADWHARALRGNIAPGVETPKVKPAAGGPAGGTRVAVLFHRVGPYHFARARAAGKAMDTLLLEVFQRDRVNGWDLVPGAEGFRRRTLFDQDYQPWGTVIRGIRQALDESRPDVVAIPGWSDAVAFGAIEWCADRRVPVIVMSETTEWDEPRVHLKEFVKRRVLKMCSAGLVGGNPHAEYLARLGMAPDRIFLGYDAVDNGYFAEKAAEAGRQKAEVQKKYGLPGHYFLASARFVGKKNLASLIRAYARYRELAAPGKAESRGSGPWSLVLPGDGPLRPDLCRLIADLHLQDFVRLPGFKQYGELPAYYGCAAAFVHASTVEQWGLVVNEAMASGLPVLVSNRCGCARDLVREGVNGFTFDPWDVEQLAQLMLKIAAPEFPLVAFGEASRRIIADWSPDRFAGGLEQAALAALAAPRPRLGPGDRMLLQVLSRVSDWRAQLPGYTGG